jgi:hypothetical protein
MVADAPEVSEPFLRGYSERERERGREGEGEREREEVGVSAML